MTDNRTNEQLSGNAGQFTDAQVEAAAKALREDKANRTDTYRVPEWEDMPYGDKLVYRGQARAALVAAQGAAPQAESEPKPHTRVVTRSFDSDCALGICMSGCSHLMWVCDSCSSEGGWGAARGQLKKWAAEHVCPVLPSSGVDEEALAEVIARSRGFGHGWEQIPPLTREAYREVARAVAEWLKGQGR